MPDQVTVQEHGTRFKVHFQEGHKTGFFCDQRENRAKLARYCQGKSVLDLCCYTGGFAIQAKRLGQANEVIGVDLDENAIKWAKANAGLNSSAVRFVHADAFSYARDMIRQQRTFDVVIVDPPKWIRNRMEIEEGKRKYYDLNRWALRLVSPGGLLLSCSCSGLLSREEFHHTLVRAAFATASLDGDEDVPLHRRIQILETTGPGPDHPIALDCPETEYLHAVWMRVARD
jgi:23S rRNA (cytosine1962-C5)-methyltransferase